MLVGAELQATADAEAAIDLAEAARGAALLDALAHAHGGHARSGARRPRARLGRLRRRPRARRRAACIAPSARPATPSTALARAGIVEQALLEGAVAETQDLMDKIDGEPEATRRGAAGARMTDAVALHAALVARLREIAPVAEPVLDAFARVPRHLFLPGVPLETVYADDAIVTHDDGGIPTSSSSQPSLMARMLDRLDVAPRPARARDRRGHRLQRRAARRARRAT